MVPACAGGKQLRTSKVTLINSTLVICVHEMPGQDADLSSQSGFLRRILDLVRTTTDFFDFDLNDISVFEP